MIGWRVGLLISRLIAQSRARRGAQSLSKGALGRSRSGSWLRPTMPTESKRSRALEAFPQDDWQTQIGDAFACLSVALFDTISRNLQHTDRLLLKSIFKSDPTLYADLFAGHERPFLGGFAHQVPSSRRVWASSAVF